MTSSEFRQWRVGMGYSQRRASEMLGLSQATVYWYELGIRGGKEVEIPKVVELACKAIKMGVK